MMKKKLTVFEFDLKKSTETHLSLTDDTKKVQA